MKRVPFTRWRYGACGLLAAAAAMAFGHLVAAVTDPASSPVLAVGSTVVDATPTPVKEWAVQTLGTSDKPVLLASVAAATAILAAVTGLLSRTRPRSAAAVLVVLAVVAGAAALLRPAAGPIDILPSVFAAVVGVATLSALRRLAAGVTPNPATEEAGTAAAARRPAPESPAPSKSPAPSESPLEHTTFAPGVTGRTARRTFLLAGTGVVVGTIALGALGQRLARPAVAAADLTLPAPTAPLPPLPVGIEGRVPGVSPFLTPAGDFYRVDTALVVPRIDVGSWRLEVGGMVDRPFSLTFDQLLAMDVVEADITLNCVSNEVGGPYISSTRWLGVRVRDLLERAGIRRGVDQIFSESVDGMTISTPVEALTDGRDALVAFAMDGRPLPPEHGFPARMVTPGLYGFVGATKWLTRLTATTYVAQQAYWTRRGWATDAPVRTQSRIDTPMGLRTYRPGPIAVGGVAWAQAGGGIGKVEVKVDDGEWQEATLGPDGGTTYWRQWSWPWQATTGRHEVTARATDGHGELQSEQRVDPFPAGASGYHSVVVIVS